MAEEETRDGTPDHQTLNDNQGLLNINIETIIQEAVKGISN